MGSFLMVKCTDMAMTSIQTLIRGSGLIYDVTDGSILLLTPGPVKACI